MAIAGRVAIVPKGEWSQSVTYDKLDLVTHNGNTFIAYKSSVGVTPVDGDTWMLILEGVDPQDIDNIINGTTPVGNANKLGGKSPSELSVANADTVDGLHASEFLLRKGTRANYLGFTSENELEIDIDGTVFPIMFGMTRKQLADKFANYLSLTGGTLRGDLTILKSSDPPRMRLRHTDGNRQGNVEVSASGWVNLNNYSDLNNLNTSFSGIMVHPHTSALSSMFQVRTNINSGEHRYSLFGEHNKPSGTYTGNGSATERTIQTGGIGNCCLIYRSDNLVFCIATPSGTMRVATNVENAEYGGFTKSTAKFEKGVLTIASTSVNINGNGATYYYQVL